MFNEQEAAEGGAVLGRERYGSYELLCLVGKFDINSVVGWRKADNTGRY